MPGKPANTIESLMKRVVIRPNGCWEWIGPLTPKGYGHVSFRGKQMRVHRIFHEHFKGKLPPGKLSCHSCDNRPCCNPDHLFEGTHLDNERDKIAKGRFVDHWALARK